MEGLMNSTYKFDHNRSMICIYHTRGHLQEGRCIFSLYKLVPDLQIYSLSAFRSSLHFPIFSSNLLHDFCPPSVLHRNHRSDDSCDFTTEESSHDKKMKVPFFNGRFWKIPRKSERAASLTAVDRKKGFWIRRSEPEPKSCSRLKEKIGKCMVPVSNIGRLKVGFLNICSI
ncbi:hypothetical protein LXL04_009301 [Taraxacum kok-saghyz]